MAGLEVIAPGDAGHLWEALRDSGAMGKELRIAEESPEEQNTSTPWLKLTDTQPVGIRGGKHYL